MQIRKKKDTFGTIKYGRDVNKTFARAECCYDINYGEQALFEQG